MTVRASSGDCKLQMLARPCGRNDDSHAGTFGDWRASNTSPACLQAVVTELHILVKKEWAGSTNPPSPWHGAMPVLERGKDPEERMALLTFYSQHRAGQKSPKPETINIATTEHNAAIVGCHYQR
ncbi:hypothetical protein TrVFT333_000839 [Trichoderma virens FT-333]|nr:hypothetical protein TrVFT333_000839 [Trichoderma virens FT-333]